MLSGHGLGLTTQSAIGLIICLCWVYRPVAHAQTDVPIGSAEQTADPGPDVANAEPTTQVSEAERAEAEEHYRRARDWYAARNYEQAAVELEVAVALDPQAATLHFNLARCRERLLNLEAALAGYVIARDLTADLVERAAAQEAIDRILALLAARRALTGTGEGQPEIQVAEIEPEELGLEPPSVTPPLSARTDGILGEEWIWAVGIAASACTITGVVFATMAGLENNEVSRFVLGTDGEITDRQVRLTSLRERALFADVFGGAGVLLLTTTALMVLFRETAIANRVRFWASHDQLGATLTLRF